MNAIDDYSLFEPEEDSFFDNSHDNPFEDNHDFEFFKDQDAFFTKNEEFQNGDTEFGSMVGNPDEWAFYYHAQTNPSSCALVAQQGILKTFGIEVSESDLIDTGIENGVFSNHNGTPMENVGDILEIYGVKTEKFYNGDIENLIDELKDGNKVIVGLDANEVWSPQSSLDPFNYWKTELPDSGHAVWITGIDKEQGVVIMNDSGIPNGQARVVEINDFLNSWEDYNNFYCTTR